jgi:hypothetical protein
MKIDIKKYYKVVIVDMKAEHEPCKDYSMGCPNCCITRLIEDLETYYEIQFDRKLK